MNFIKCEKLEKSMAELQFSIDAEAFKAAVADVFKKEGKKYPVQGFRKGKAPKALIEKMYGADVFTYDAINELFPAAYEAAVKEAGIEPVGRPEVSVDAASETEGVTLTVSLGIQYVTVPDVSNYVQADGEQQLKDLGVSVLITQAVEPSVAAGSIIRTEPAAGSQVAAGTTVVVYVSRPQVATTTKVPSLIGMNVDDARTLLVQRKLGLGSQTEQYSDQPVGSIISQNPGEGASAKLNTRVSVVVSAGPEPAPEPEAPSESTDGSGGWWGGLFGGSSSSSESTGASSSSSTTGGGLSDWWTSWLG